MFSSSFLIGVFPKWNYIFFVEAEQNCLFFLGQDVDEMVLFAPFAKQDVLVV